MSKWIDRALIISPVYYTLCTDEKDFYKQMKYIRMPIKEQPEFMVEGSGATTHSFNCDDGRHVAIVCIGTDNKNFGEVCSLLAHEAVHIFQFIRELMGEKNPSVEFEAYSIQMITQQLIIEYERQIKEAK